MVAELFSEQRVLEAYAMPSSFEVSIPKHFNVAGAATASGLSKTIIKAALKSKALTARKAGRRVVIFESDLASYLTNLPAYGEKAAA